MFFKKVTTQGGIHRCSGGSSKPETMHVHRANINSRYGVLFPLLTGLSVIRTSHGRRTKIIVDVLDTIRRPLTVCPNPTVIDGDSPTVGRRGKRFPV